MASDFGSPQPDSDGIGILAGRVVLVLEPNALVALDLGDLLKDVGAGDVLIAAHAAEASQIVHQIRPDLALLALPERQELLAALAQQLAALNVPVIFVSSFDEPSPSLLGNQSTHLRLPVSPDALQAALTHALG